LTHRYLLTGMIIDRDRHVAMIWFIGFGITVLKPAMVLTVGRNGIPALATFVADPL
jgi:hypothetical protein